MVAVVVPAWPFENADTTETQYSRILREVGDGVLGSFGEAALRVTADSTGMNVKVNPGPGLLRGHGIQPTGITTLTVQAAEAAVRLDRVVARIDPGANAGYLDVVKGTAGSATPPPLTQTDTGVYEIPLGIVTVGVGVVSIAPAAVTDDRVWIGNKVAIGNVVNPRYGMIRRNTTANKWEWWDGDSWENLLPSTAWADITGKPATFPPAPHTHDDRYFTEAEITTILTGYQPAGSYASASHNHGNAYVKSRVGQDVQLRYAPEGHPAFFVDGAEFFLASQSWVETRLGLYRALGNTDFNAFHIYNLTGRNTPVTSSYVAAYLNGDGRLGASASSIRYKEDVELADLPLDELLEIDDVTYHRIGDETDYRELGMIAEHVVERAPGLAPYLVAFDVPVGEDGMTPLEGAPPRPQTVRYESALPVLLHALAKRQAAEIAELRRRLDALDGGAA